MNFEKYGKIYALGHDENKEIFAKPEDTIYIEEKIDGANFRFMAVDNRLIFGSRNQSLGDDQQDIGGNWARCVKYLKEKLNGQTIPSKTIFYGECCVKHSLEYDWMSIPPYLGFEIASGQGYYGYEEKKRIFEGLHLPIVPLIRIAKAKELINETINDSFIPKSAYASSPAEGVIFKNYDSGIFAKYVTDKFKEINKEAFGGGKKFAETDDDIIVAAYCTNPRIDKHVFALIEEGNTLDMSLMRFLPKRVIEDIIVENWGNILRSKYTLNLHRIRQKIAQRCKAVLQQIITNNALNKKTE